MKFYYFLIIFISAYAFGNIVNNVRVIDHIGYMTNVIGETIRQVEYREWCNLKVPNASVTIDDIVMGWPIKGTVNYTDGFVVSIQAVDIQQSTVQVQVNLNADQHAQAIVRGTLRMHDVAIGYEVRADLEDGVRWYTAIYVYPIVNVAFTVTKIIDSDVINALAETTVTASQNRPRFMPRDKATDVFTTLFEHSMSVSGINSWGPEIFQPIVQDVVTRHVKFPDICYNCAA